MLIPPTPEVPPLFWRAAVHEAGHVVADHLGGFCPVECVLLAKEGGGRTDVRDRQATRETVEDYVISCLAGRESELAHVGDSELAASGAFTDLQKAKSVLPYCPEQDLSVYETRARALVTDSTNQHAIHVIATELVLSKRLAGRELQLVIDLAFGGTGAADALRRYRESSGQLLMAVIRKQINGIMTHDVTDEVFDSVVFGDFAPLDESVSVTAFPNSEGDLRRAERMSSQSDLVLEHLDGTARVVVLKRVCASNMVVQLFPFTEEDGVFGY